MPKIKLIDENTDLSHLNKPLGLDLKVNCVPYDVYMVEGYNHTVGGKWGENCYWTCPSGELPSYQNLIQFNGDAPAWGITFERSNYKKSKWDQTSIECEGICWITRNGENFYCIYARNMEYGLAKAQYFLVKLLEECPVWLSERNWKENTIGKKIWYNNQPAIITKINSENELWIEPDGIEKFEAPPYWDKYLYKDYEDGMYVDLLSEDVCWHRD